MGSKKPTIRPLFQRAGGAMRLSVELMVGILVAVAGYYADQWLGKRSAWLFILCFFLWCGGAGFRNMLCEGENWQNEEYAEITEGRYVSRSQSRTQPVSAVRGLNPLLPFRIGPFDLSFSQRPLWMLITIAAATLLMYIGPAPPRFWFPSLAVTAEILRAVYGRDTVRDIAGENVLEIFPLCSRCSCSFFRQHGGHGALFLSPSPATSSSPFEAMAIGIFLFCTVLAIAKHGPFQVRAFFPAARHAAVAGAADDPGSRFFPISPARSAFGPTCRQHDGRGHTMPRSSPLRRHDGLLGGSAAAGVSGGAHR